jgi:hypothetical protein
MPRNAARRVNHATVVGCAISATRNYLKSQMPERLNPHTCATLVPKRESRRGVLRSGLPPLDPMRSITPTAVGAVGVSACRPQTSSALDIKPPIALAASQCPTPRDFVPWRFLVARRTSVWSVSSFRRPKTCTGADVAGRRHSVAAAREWWLGHDLLSTHRKGPLSTQSNGPRDDPNWRRVPFASERLRLLGIQAHQQVERAFRGRKPVGFLVSTGTCVLEIQSSEPSALYFNGIQLLTLNLLSGFAT